MGLRHALILVAMLAVPVGPALGQLSVLDRAQDAVSQPASPAQAPAPAAPAPICGSQPLTIARMSWPSSILLAEIHARILQAQFDCDIRLTQGDLGATASAMGSNGQPAVAPELWVNRVADVWNGAMEAQMVRSAAPSYAETSLEGWFMPLYAVDSLGGDVSAAGLAATLPLLSPGRKTPFISCPLDWACSIINRNLVAAHGLTGLVEIVEPANRFEMDRLIAEAVNRREPFLFYYWQPNAVLAQLDFAALDMGEYDEEAARCLADRDCADPRPSAFAPEQVVIALVERVFTGMPQIAAYFQRARMPLAEMNQLLAQLNQPGTTPEAVAERFVAERQQVWQAWVETAY